MRRPSVRSCTMVAIARKTPVLEGVAPERIPFAELLEAGQPAVLKGVARHWPLVRHGLESAGRAMDYIRSFAGAKPVLAYLGPPEINGTFLLQRRFHRPQFCHRARTARCHPRSHWRTGRAAADDLDLCGIDRPGQLPARDCGPRMISSSTTPCSSATSPWSASGSATARWPVRITINTTTSPAAWSADAASACFRPSRFAISIPVRWSRPPAARS